MKRRNLTLTFLAASAALLATTGALPAEEGHRGPRGPRAERGHHARGPMQALGTLDLTEAQREEIKALLETHREMIEPLHEEGRMIREEIKTLTEQDAPDAEQLGSLMLEGKALREEIRSAREASWEEVKTLLTPEQLEKLALLEEMHQSRRHERKERREGRRGRTPHPEG